MSMEKNGAISRSTPSGCCGGNCHSQKTEKSGQQLNQMPSTEAEADEMERDITKLASDAVKDASQNSSENNK
jgi:hypothetical protein